MPQAGEQQAPHQARRAEKHEREGDRVVGQARDLLEERLNVTVAGEVRRDHDDGDEVHAQKRAGAQKARQLPQRERLSRIELGEHERKACDDGERHDSDGEKRRTPPDGKAEHAPARQAENHGDRRSHAYHGKRERGFRGGGHTHRERSDDRPEHRMSCSNSDARRHKHPEVDRCRRKQLADAEQDDHAEEQPLRRHLRHAEHKRQRQNHDRPCVHGDEHARHRLGHVEIRGNVGEQADGHELRRVEHEGRKRHPHKRNPKPHRHEHPLPFRGRPKNVHLH